MVFLKISPWKQVFHPIIRHRGAFPVCSTRADSSADKQLNHFQTQAELSRLEEEGGEARVLASVSSASTAAGRRRSAAPHVCVAPKRLLLGFVASDCSVAMETRTLATCWADGK